MDGTGSDERPPRPEPLSPTRGVPDPEVLKLALAYTRAVAITERLAGELEEVTSDLASYVHARKPKREESRRATRRRT